MERPLARSPCATCEKHHLPLPHTLSTALLLAHATMPHMTLRDLCATYTFAMTSV